jgi:hypothetical protein
MVMIRPRAACTILLLALVVAISSPALARGRDHERRDNEDRRISALHREGEYSGREAAQLHREFNQGRRQERREARAHGGWITKAEKREKREERRARHQRRE